MLLRSLRVLLACLCLAFAAIPAQAQQVQLTWDAPVQADGTPVPTLAGYKLYYGSQSGQYPTMIPVGLTTTYTVTNVPTGQTSYFAVKAYDSTGTDSAFSNEVSVTPGTIPQQQMRVVSIDSQELVGDNGAATNAIDGNSTTFWHTAWSQQTAPLPHTLVLDLGGQYLVDGLRYVPRQDGNPNGTIAGYECSVSADGTTWGTAVAAGTFAADTTEKTVRFTATTGRYVRLIAVSEINGQAWTSAAELSVFGTAVSSSTTTTTTLVTSSTSTSTPATSPSPPLQAPTTGGASTAPASTTTTAPSSTTTTTVSSSTTTTTGAALTSASAPPALTTTQNTLWELPLTSTNPYANPFTDVTVTVTYTKPGSPPLAGYGFWDGDATFKLRQAFPEPGTWHYTTTATDPSDTGLHHQEGDVQVLPYTGTNPLYRHGALQVSADHRALVHADGTPFLWLGDTLWGATVWLTDAGWHAAVADRRAKHFTVLQTNFAYADEVDTAGDTPWQGDRWNVRFMQKLDRLFTDANEQGMYLVVNGLADLAWDRGIAAYDRLVAMIGARYGAHFVSFASSMAEAYDPLHEQINATLRLTAPRALLTQHPGAAPTGQGAVATAEQYYDTPGVDYVLEATRGDGDLDLACQQAIEWSLRLYNHIPPKPVINGQAWYEGIAGGTADMTLQLGYLSLLSGSVGYTYGTSLWNATDADLPAWMAARGATYMQYLYEFVMTLDAGRPLQPHPELIQNQATRAQERMVVGVTADGLTYAAFLPQGGSISVDLTALAGTTVGVTWYDPRTGQYQDQGTTAGGAVGAFLSPFGMGPAALVLMAQ